MEQQDLVSVIVPTFNRFDFLLNTIDSIRKQTYKNIEIIVINDCSDDKRYTTHDWGNVNMLHLPISSKNVIGYPCSAYVRNQGILVAKGKYVAFCDDDDIWFPEKIDKQISAMKKSGCKMSSTEGLHGFGPYNSSKEYKKFNQEYHYDIIQDIFKSKGSNLIVNGFPDIWNYDLLKVHNCMITSSVVLEKEILEKIQMFKHMKNSQDYDCWLKALRYTDSVYVRDVLFYYDGNHGFGRNYIR